MLQFQFLIGNLGTGIGIGRMQHLHKFQFLIGNLGTANALGSPSATSTFQFLIGNLGTILSHSAENGLRVGFNSL